MWFVKFLIHILGGVRQKKCLIVKFEVASIRSHRHLPFESNEEYVTATQLKLLSHISKSNNFKVMT